MESSSSQPQSQSLPALHSEWRTLDQFKAAAQASATSQGFRLATVRTTKTPDSIDRYVSYACNGEGGSRHTSTCKMRFTLKGNDATGWKVMGIVPEHNHVLIPGNVSFRRPFAKKNGGSGGGIGSGGRLRKGSDQTGEGKEGGGGLISLSQDRDDGTTDPILLAESNSPSTSSLFSPATSTSTSTVNSTTTTATSIATANELTAWLTHDFTPYPLTKHASFFTSEGISSPYEFLTLSKIDLEDYFSNLKQVGGFDKKRILSKIEYVRTGRASFRFSSSDSTSEESGVVGLVGQTREDRSTVKHTHVRGGRNMQDEGAETERHDQHDVDIPVPHTPENTDSSLVYPPNDYSWFAENNTPT